MRQRRGRRARDVRAWGAQVSSPPLVAAGAEKCGHSLKPGACAARCSMCQGITVTRAAAKRGEVGA